MRADIERRKGKPQQALTLLGLIVHQIEAQENVEVFEEFHRIKYEAFKDLGNASEALSAHEQFQFYHMTVFKSKPTAWPLPVQRTKRTHSIKYEWWKWPRSAGIFDSGCLNCGWCWGWFWGLGWSSQCWSRSF